MSMFSSINTSASGLTAEKTRIDIINKNIANANTERTSGGGPYRRQMVVFEEDKRGEFSKILGRYTNNGSRGNGVRISKVVEDDTPFKMKYEPGHPNANEDGYVEMPNVERVTEMVDLISAQRSYDANITAMNASKSLLMKALDIGRR